MRDDRPIVRFNLLKRSLAEERYRSRIVTSQWNVVSLGGTDKTRDAINSLIFRLVFLFLLLLLAQSHNCQENRLIKKSKEGRIW